MTTRTSGTVTFGPDYPAASGTYLLALHTATQVSLSVGRLGAVTLSPGHYVYIGSAHGPGGLAARLARHLSAEKRRHWHVDTLTAMLRVAAVWFKVSPERLECVWVQRLLAAGASAPIPGFGSTDCRAGCPAHLLRLPAEPGDASALSSFEMILHE